MDKSPTVTTEVAIIGAGPVGLLLAAELALAGVVPTVLERRAELDPTPKARGVGPLAVEALRRRGLGPTLDFHHPSGLADWVAEHGGPNAHFAHLYTFAFPDERDRVFIWQPQLEEVLADHATHLGVTVLRKWELTDLDQDSDTVFATFQTPDGTRVVEARYVVGCDGGRSSVRRLAGFEFPGAAPLSVTRAGEVDLDDPDNVPAPGSWPGGMLMIRRGMIGTVEYGPGAQRARDDGPLTIEELTDSIERVTGQRITISNLRDSRCFNDGTRQVADYRNGRVLLGGDAAHVHSPNGGQGLDLGLMDAVNLGWKLAASVRGNAPSGLLDTYSSERHPFAAAVLRNTMAQAALLAPGAHHEALKNIVSELMDLDQVKGYFSELMSRLHQRYPLPDRAISDSDTRRQGHAEWAGLHIPDFPVLTAEGDTTAYALAHSGKALLIHSQHHGQIGETARAWHDHVDVVASADTVLDGCAGVLIRPDGVVAWTTRTGHADELPVLERALRTWFGSREAGHRSSDIG